MLWMVGYLGAGSLVTWVLGRHGRNHVAAKKTLLLAMIWPARPGRVERTPASDC